MDSDDGGVTDSIATASTDTSLFLRELQALNKDEGEAGPVSLNQSVVSGTIEVGGSGEVGEDPTLTQAMKTMLSADRPCQVINLEENSDENGVGVYSREVAVYAAPTSSNIAEKSSGSNKIKITPVVNHVWEKKFYYGNLVAVHRDTDYVAYVLTGKSGGNVRVMSRKTANRVLLKTFTGNVMDIAFALSDDVYLASVDETGTVFVHSFTSEGDSILTNIVLHIEKEVFNIESAYRALTRVIWCPYMPEEEGAWDCMDPAKMLVLLHGTQAEVWNVDYVSKELGMGGPDNTVTSSKVDVGVMVIEPYEPLMPVVNAAFAPDGSAIAVAYQSGIVKFFLVDLEGVEGELECMYDWNPHDGEPVSALYFLDDHKHTVSTDLQLWKFALTGAKYNTEIKIWSCETWACTQTIVLNPPLSQLDHTLQLTSQIDLSSHYLTLSDINSRVLYVLQLHQNYGHCAAHVTSMSHFSLAQTCVSCAIFDAGMKKFKHSANDSHLDEITTGELDRNEDDEEEGGESRLSTGVQIKMYGVHTKSLQELLIRYRPETSVPPLHTPSVSSVSQDEAALRDLLSDMSMDHSESGADAALNHTPSMDPTQLIAPTAFISNSPSASQSLGDPSSVSHNGGPLTAASSHNLSGSSTSSFTQVTAMNDDIPLGSPTGSRRADNSSLNLASDTPQQGGRTSGECSPLIIALTPPEPQESPSGGSSTITPTSKEDGSKERKEEDSEEQQEEEAGQGEPAPNTTTLAVVANGGSPSEHQAILLEELFSSTTHSGGQPGLVSGLGQSIETASSTGSFPVTTERNLEERYDEDDKEVAEALGESDTEEGLPERQEVVWPEPPDVSTEAKRLVDQAIEQSTQEDEEEVEEVLEKGSDFDDDEEEEAEVEEIISHHNSMVKNEEEDDDDGQEEESESMSGFIDIPDNRPHRPEPGQAPVTVLTNLEGTLASLADRLEQQQEVLTCMQAQLRDQRDLQLKLHRQQQEQYQLHQVAAAAAAATQQQQQQQQQPSLEKEVAQLEDILVSRMEHSLAQHMQRETQRMQDSLRHSEAQRKQRNDAMQASLTQEMSRQLKETITTSMRHEIKQTVNPALQRHMDPLKERLHQEVAHRLTACDALLKDNISKAVKSRSTMDVLASSIGDVIYQQLQHAYTETFKTMFLPSFSASVEKTVRDVHGIFQQGTKEYQLYMRQNMDQIVRERGASGELLRRLEEAQNHFLQSVATMREVVVSTMQEEMGAQMARSVSGVKEEILGEVRRMMKDEMTTALREHGSHISDQLNTYLRSGAGTPVPAMNSSEEENIKDKITRDLKAGRINEAFQIALSAGDLSLVIFVCEASSPLQIFSQAPCPLTQPVLLSLISQLSASLDKSFDLKMKFLEEAVLNLDLDQQLTAEHIPNVLGVLVQRLRAVNVNNEPRKVKSIKMLIMAANSLLT